MMSILSLAKPFGKRIDKVWVAEECTQKRPPETGKHIPGSLAALLLGVFAQGQRDWEAEGASGPLNTHVDWLIGLDQGIRGG